jgi:glycerol-3-phosphate dehydrogenase
MAEDCVDQAATLAQLPEKPCATHHLRIHGFHDPIEDDPVKSDVPKEDAAKEFPSLAIYGSDAGEIRKLIDTDAKLGEPLHPALPYIKAEVVWAVRHEMARTIEDVLARRTRALFLNARAALEMAPAVAQLMSAELDWDEPTQAKQLAKFREVASNYILQT